jgi:hypothetical protein
MVISSPYEAMELGIEEVVREIQSQVNQFRSLVNARHTPDRYPDWESHARGE